MNKYRIGVVGSGLMGKSLVEFLLLSDAVDSVVWRSGRGDALDAPLAHVHKTLVKLKDKGKITPDVFDAALNKVIISSSFSDYASCDVIHEAVSEDFEIKKQIIYQLAKNVRDTAVIASNTSSLSITELSFSGVNPSRVIGIHFFNPAPVMRLVEIVPGIATSPSVVDFSKNYVSSLGKSAVLVEESPGFIVNRILMPMINEAICILAEHIASKEDIDLAMRYGANHPIGPLALADMIGNDIVLNIMEVLYSETGDQKYRPHPLLRKMVRAGKLGRKSQSGFYEY